jgi:hypothetical protein
LTDTDRKTTRRATVACRSENVVRKDWIRNQAKPGTPKRRKDRERLWKGPQCNNGIRDRRLRQQLRGRMRINCLCGGEPLYLRKERRTTNDIGGWNSGQQSHLRSGKTLKKILYAIFRGKIAKLTV